MEEVNWTQEHMLEVGLKEPDDFLKVRETLSRIGVASRKERKLYNPVIYYISRVGIILFISKSYLLLMERKPICLKMILQDEIRLQIY